MEKVKVYKFCPGMSVEATYITPSNGRVDLNLCDREENIMLHVNPRMDQVALVLNTLSGGSWGQEERPDGFNFSSRVPLTLRVECREECYTILCNGKVIHKYNHRMPTEAVKLITWNTNADARLLSLSIGY